MKTVRIIMIIGLVTLFNVVKAQPQERFRGERNNLQEFRQQGLAALDLTDEQQTKADELRLKMQKASLPIRNKLGENRAKLRTLSTAETPDMKAINKLIDENAELRASLEKLRAANHQEFRKMLTEEQRIQFDNRQQRQFRGRDIHHGEGRGQRYGRGHGQGQGRHFKGQLE